MIISVYCKECGNELEVSQINTFLTDIKIIVNTCDCGDTKMCADCTKQLENQYIQTIGELEDTIEKLKKITKLYKGKNK